MTKEVTRGILNRFVVVEGHYISHMCQMEIEVSPVVFVDGVFVDGEVRILPNSDEARLER